MPPGEDDPPQPCPVPASQPAGPGVRMRGGLTGRPAITTCTCSETLVRLEREKLVVLRGIEGQLKRQTALQEEMVRIKQERLELHRRQLALAEAQFNRPSISVPIILPQDSGTGHFYFLSALRNVSRSISLINLPSLQVMQTPSNDGAEPPPHMVSINNFGFLFNHVLCGSSKRRFMTCA